MGKKRSNEELIQVKEAIQKELIKMNISPIMVHYPTIIDAIDELLEVRKKDEDYWFMIDH
jgi:hypothetical protein